MFSQQNGKNHMKQSEVVCQQNKMVWVLLT